MARAGESRIHAAIRSLSDPSRLAFLVTTNAVPAVQTGDWKTASFDDLAGDVVAAFNYLKRRRDIEPGQIGLLGVSQAGWIIAVGCRRARGLLF